MTEGELNVCNRQLIIPETHDGDRVDVALAKMLPEFSRSQLTAWLKTGLITLNGRSIKPKEKLSGGERVILSLENQETLEPCDNAEFIPLDIVFEDEQVLLVNKPPGLVVHPGAGNPKHTLLNALLYHDPALQRLPRAGIIHRLDKDTSGLLMIAKTHQAHTSLVRQMQDRTIHRKYLALVYGHVVSGGKIETLYGRHPRNRLKMAVCHQGREAVTEYSVQKKYQQFTLLEVKLLTGRTHQIRVHMAHIHRPIVGDQLYSGRLRLPAGATPALKTALQSFKRQALHAFSLGFDHPLSNERLTLMAPLPHDFQFLLARLDEWIENSQAPGS